MSCIVNRAAVRRLRITNGYTVTALAARAGCSKGMVSAIEHGNRGVSPGLLGRLADALAVTPEALMATEDTTA